MTAITVILSWLPSFCRHFIILWRLPFNYRHLPLPTRSLPRCRVTEQIYRLITAVLHYRPDHYRGFSLPNKCNRPLPRCRVTEQIYRRITAILHYRPDHYRGVALPNKFTVELPPSSITDKVGYRLKYRYRGTP